MKRFLILLSILFCTIAVADTINLHWLNEDGTTYENSTCVIDSDLEIPSTNPTKRGHTFAGWRSANIQRIEYLESTGTQYIDTGFAYDSSISSVPFKMDFTISFVQYINFHNAYAPLSGVYDNNSRIMMFVQDKYNTERFMMSHSTVSSNIDISACDIVPTLQEPTNIVFITNPTQGTQELHVKDCANERTTPTNPTSTKNLWLFKSNGQISGWINNWPVRIHRWTLESNGVKIRDFIPVLDYNGTPCLYDRVEHKFYYNAGTGQFIAGPVVSE